MRSEDLLLAMNELDDDLILEETEVSSPKRLSFRRLGVLLTAAVIVSTMVLTAFASEDGTRWLKQFFSSNSGAGLSDSQTAYIQENALALQKRQTQNGYTLTLDTAISDGVHTYIRFQLTAPEGVVLDANAYTFQNWPKLVNEAGEAYTGSGGWDTIDDDLTDNVTSLLYTCFHTWDDDNYDSIYASVWNLELVGLEARYYDNPGTVDFTYEDILLADGIWKFDITFPETGNQSVEFISEPVTCPCEVNIGIQGYHYEDVQITSLTVRALSAALTFRHPKEELLNGCFDDLYAVMKDGSQVLLVEDSGAPNYLTYKFEAPIVLADIDHILLPNGIRLQPPA